MNVIASEQHPQALAHGTITEVLEGVFFVSGAMETQLMDLEWKFSRNMVVVRDGERLIIINSIRLDEQGLSELDKLGQVTDVIRLGALHGRDDAFYVERYQAKYWAVTDSDEETPANVLSPETSLPISGASLFTFNTTKIPEAILFLDREGGIAIACDALQNWLNADEHFCEASKERMQQMGFFTPANIGPVWMQAAQPSQEDFVRLQKIPFKHALCGHGEPLLNTANEEFQASFAKIFSL